jgi:hypothetical protein
MSAASKAMWEGARIAPERSCAEFVDAVAAVNERIDDPVDKLHYLRTSLNLHPDSERALRHVPWSAARRWLAQLMSAAALQRCVQLRGIQANVAMPHQLLELATRSRQVALMLVGILSIACVLLTMRWVPAFSDDAAHAITATSSPTPVAMTPIASAPASTSHTTIFPSPSTSPRPRRRSYPRTSG